MAQLLRQEKAYDVILTRDSDVFVPLEDRSRLANEAGADLFISLHCNYSRSHAVNGFEIYFLSEKASDPEAELVARFENESLKFENGRSGAPEDNIEALTILSELERMEFINQASELGGFIAREMSARVKIENRGLKQAAFYVLRGTRSPALLIEMGYISNSRDAALLSQAKVRNRIVDGIYAGVLKYAKRKGW
ncbi:MAG: hypothetical protein A3G41_01310 [Elusimicrobia bacterium RIFCSPLOWO2_12_FULL_59_9]|nr:MAG: hypothetical protein A3G41_01310 [Elusimicrobia bacterium RIFCSPLOWO2_12_FULL_59_9]